MKPSRLPPLLLILVSLLSRLAAAQVADDAAIRKILQERLDSKLSAGIVVGVLDAGARRVVAYGNLGPSDRPLDGDTVFEIGSVTKVFTATLLADMARRGEVKLDDPISNYLPATVRTPSRSGKPITLIDLATQTSGLPRLPGNLAPGDPDNPYADYSVEQMYDFLSHYELPRKPGEKYEYSNLGVGLLGHLLAQKVGLSYEQLVTRRILEPLDMRDTGITLWAPMRARLAPGHDASGAAASNWDIPTLAGAGALRSTVHDMLKFLAANLAGGKGLLAPALQETHRARHATGLPGLEIGLAWHILHRFGTDLVWHNGGTGGYHSWIGFLKRRQRAVVVLSNSASSTDDIGLHLIDSRFPLFQPPRTKD